MAILQSFLSSFQIGAATGWDLFIMFIFLIIVLIYGFFLGRNRIVVLLLGSYFSWAIIQVMPWQRLAAMSWLGIEGAPSPSLKMLVFLGLILIFYFLIPRSILSSTLRIRKRGEASWAQLFLLSIVQLGFVASALISFLSSEVVSEFAPVVKKIFIGGDAQFVWIALPIFVMTLMRKKKKMDD